MTKKRRSKTHPQRVPGESAAERLARVYAYLEEFHAVPKRLLWPSCEAIERAERLKGEALADRDIPTVLARVAEQEAMRRHGMPKIDPLPVRVLRLRRLLDMSPSELGARTGLNRPGAKQAGRSFWLSLELGEDPLTSSRSVNAVANALGCTTVAVRQFVAGEIRPEVLVAWPNGVARSYTYSPKRRRIVAVKEQEHGVGVLPPPFGGPHMMSLVAAATMAIAASQKSKGGKALAPLTRSALQMTGATLLGSAAADMFRAHFPAASAPATLTSKQAFLRIGAAFERFSENNPDDRDRLGDFFARAWGEDVDLTTFTNEQLVEQADDLAAMAETVDACRAEQRFPSTKTSVHREKTDDV